MDSPRIQVLLSIIASALIFLCVLAFISLRYQRAELRRALAMSSSVGCFSIQDVQEMVDTKAARENCRYGIYRIEEEFDW